MDTLKEELDKDLGDELEGYRVVFAVGRGIAWKGRGE